LLAVVEVAVQLLEQVMAVPVVVLVVIAQARPYQ
jgi:hypothetical protein